MSVIDRAVRRPRAFTSAYLVNQLSLRRPLIVTFWAAMLPGFGQLMLCKYFNGMLMMLLELLLNTKSHLNLAIYDSMIGKFAEASKVLDTHWFLAYSGVFFFNLRDSYQKSIQLNKHSLIADGEDSPIVPTKISALEINTLDLRNPREAIFWSLVCPGFGHILVNRLPTGFFLIAWYVLICYMSDLFPAMLATFHGNFHKASSLIHPQWFLYLPSILGFAANDAYVQCRALNRAFKVEQTRFFKTYYQRGEL